MSLVHDLIATSNIERRDWSVACGGSRRNRRRVRTPSHQIKRPQGRCWKFARNCVAPDVRLFVVTAPPPQPPAVATSPTSAARSAAIEAPTASEVINAILQGPAGLIGVSTPWPSPLLRLRYIDPGVAFSDGSNRVVAGGAKPTAARASCGPVETTNGARLMPRKSSAPPRSRPVTTRLQPPDDLNELERK